MIPGRRIAIRAAALMGLACLGPTACNIVAPAAYIVAVVPWQTQAETYTLTANPGGLQFAAIAPGFTATCPPIVCPF